MEYELTRKWPFNDSCTDHVNAADMEHVARGREHTEKKGIGFNWSIFCLVISRDITVAETGDEVYTLSDGRHIHHQSRMFVVPPIYYQAPGRTIFQFFNDEYLEADGHFILRIIGTNAR